jgi:hypothetical protein
MLGSVVQGSAAFFTSRARPAAAAVHSPQLPPATAAARTAAALATWPLSQQLPRGGPAVAASLAPMQRASLRLPQLLRS